MMFNIMRLKGSFNKKMLYNIAIIMKKAFLKPY